MKKFEKVKNIHFVGIGGAGMIGIAKVLLQKGYSISGSDLNFSDDLVRLQNDGAKVFHGHAKENIKGSDLLVVSSAIDKDNPEIIQAQEDQITVIPRAEMLGSIMIGYESIAVAGSHGKTTTTSMVAKIFSEANLSPTYVVGGKVLSTDENSDLGKGKYLVAEADESDGTFIHLQPDVALITNIDDDHLSHYNNIFENLLDSFVTFLENIPFWGYMVINGDDKDVLKVSKRISRKQVTFGETRSCNYQISDIRSANGKQSFRILDTRKDKFYNFLLNIPGKHNVFNAAGSIAVALEESIEIQIIQKAISEFSGVGRRYEKHAINVSSKDIILIDDYGHHPIEIDANLSAIKEEFSEKKVCMIFQPHRYTRTEQLFDDFVRVLARVDSLILLDIYEASEKPIKGINSKAIAQKIIQQGHSDVIHVTDHSKINQILNLKKDHIDVLVTQGAGSISKVCESIIKNA
tara:strand:+ start:2305 stop:3693 length:1389 start_codon:yes stop_codon:yes gene_type:complete